MKAKLVYVVEWTNGESYEDYRTDPVAVFSGKADAHAFAKKANAVSDLWAERYRRWLEGDMEGTDPQFRSKYDRNRGSDASRSQKYYVIKRRIPLDPPL